MWTAGHDEHERTGTHTNAHERTNDESTDAHDDNDIGRPEVDYCKEELLEPYDELQHMDEIRELFTRSRDLYVDRRTCEPNPLLYQVLSHLRSRKYFIDLFSLEHA